MVSDGTKHWQETPKDELSRTSTLPQTYYPSRADRTDQFYTNASRDKLVCHLIL